MKDQLRGTTNDNVINWNMNQFDKVSNESH